MDWIYDSQLESNCMVERYSEIFFYGRGFKGLNGILSKMKTWVGRNWYQSIHFDKLSCGASVLFRPQNGHHHESCISVFSALSIPVGVSHKVLTYVEYRAVSGVFQNIDPPPPSPLSECVLSQYQRRMGTHSPGGEGVGGQYIGKRQTLDWPLTV